MAITLLRAENGFKHYKTDALDLSGTNQSDSIDVFKALGGSWQIVWDTVVGTADVEIQVSHDGGTNWDTISGSNFTTSGAGGSQGNTQTQLAGAMLRLACTSAATSGNATLYLLFKEDV